MMQKSLHTLWFELRAEPAKLYTAFAANLRELGYGG